MQGMTVPPAQPGSWEDDSSRDGLTNPLLPLDGLRGHATALEPAGYRAIGGVYHPWNERPDNYVPTVLPWRYDASIYLDQTEAQMPLHRVWARASAARFQKRSPQACDPQHDSPGGGESHGIPRSIRRRESVGRQAGRLCGPP